MECSTEKERDGKKGMAIYIKALQGNINGQKRSSQDKCSTEEV